jgi:hypothetical protein
MQHSCVIWRGPVANRQRRIYKAQLINRTGEICMIILHSQIAHPRSMMVWLGMCAAS